MEDNTKSRKLEIHVPTEVAEKLYDAIIELIEVTKQHASATNSETGLVGTSLLEKYLDQTTKEHYVAIERVISKKVTKLSEEIKDLITKDIESTLKKLNASLKSEAKIKDNVIILLSRYSRINEGHHNDTIEFQIANKEINKIVRAILFIVNNLDEESLI